jgi:hypothetical protein
MTLREKIAALLKPAIDVRSPYAAILIDTLVKLAEAEGAQARAELAKLKTRLNDLHDVPPEHESEPLPFHRGWELAVRAVAS